MAAEKIYILFKYLNKAIFNFANLKFYHTFIKSEFLFFKNSLWSGSTHLSGCLIPKLTERH